MENDNNNKNANNNNNNTNYNNNNKNNKATINKTKKEIWIYNLYELLIITVSYLKVSVIFLIYSIYIKADPLFLFF